MYLCSWNAEKISSESIIIIINLSSSLLLLLTLSSHAREGYSSHFVSVCLSLFDFGEDAIFRVETYVHQYILVDDLSPSNVALL